MSIQGRIIKGVGGLYTVRTEKEDVECRARGSFRKQNLTPLVGDRVTVENGVIVEIHDRKNSLIRPACANIDKLFLVAALSSPDPSVYHLDKMLAIASYHRIEPVLIFNKTDLDDVCRLREIYDRVPVRRYELCAAAPDENVLCALRGEIAGKTVAFSGVSGVGKSTIVNLLDPSRRQQTGNLSEKLSRGKHTTRCVELFDMCGGCVMDTPGFSHLLLEYFEMFDRTYLADCFAEFAPYIGQCRFDDCRHIKEPGCAVTKALDEGLISPSRYESYRMMYDELGEYKEWEKKES